MVSTSLHSKVEWGGVQPLPAPLTPLVGRADEVAGVIALLWDPGVRLITLRGPGGVGKTRLALHVASTLDPTGRHRRSDAPTPFPAGVGFVPLAPVADPGLVGSAIAGALQVSHDDLPALDAVVDTLGMRRMLLVLDNFEHLTPAAPLVSELLAACPRLKVMVISRSLLRISGEYDVRVGPLGFPAATSNATLADLAASDAAVLFMERSRAILADRGLGDADAPAIAEICSRLDGLPLAIELAAARVAILSPKMLAERLDRRLPLLIGGARDLPARQQTLRGAIAWSDHLLSPAERWLFHHLALFSGGFTLEAAAALLAHSPHEAANSDASLSALSLEYITSLMGHSLLLRTDPAGGAPRFSMLATLREYAIERLQEEGEYATARHQHACYMLALALQATNEFSGPDQRLWIERVEADHDNLRSALSWALDHEPKLALQLSSALWRFWEIRGLLLEGRSWLERALAAPGGGSDRVRATALNNLGNLIYRLADYARARELYEQSLEINRVIDDQGDIADSLNNLGLVASAQGDYRAARAFLEESLAVRRREHRPDRLSLGLHNFGEMEIDAGNPELAGPALREALTLRHQRGDDRGAAYVRYNLGRVALAQGDVSASEAELRNALGTFRGVGEKIGIADTLIEVGLVSLDRGDGEEAVRCLHEGLQLRINLGDKRGVLAGLEAVARLAVSRGHYPAAARLTGAADHHRALLQIPPTAYGRGAWERTTNIVERSLGRTSFVEYQAEGASWTLAAAIEAAFTELAREPSTGEPRSATRNGLPALTPRERDVLRLVVQGLADREIAAELSISPRTASTHVTNILHKLGENSRTAAAAYAVRHDLE